MPVTVTPVSFQFAHPRQYPWKGFKWKNPIPDPDVVRQACFGLPYRDPQPIDAPATKLKSPILRSQLEKALTNQWGVPNVDAAHRFCNDLLGCGGYSPVFDAFLKPSDRLSHQVKHLSPADFESYVKLQASFLEHLFFFNGMDPQRWTQCFHKWIHIYLHPQFQAVAPDKLPHTTRAWDLVRVEAIAGRSVGLGWFTPEEGQHYAARAVAELQKSFASWQQVALSFWWGRAMWLSDEPIDFEVLTGFDSLFALAFTDPNSPWVRVPLRG